MHQNWRIGSVPDLGKGKLAQLGWRLRWRLPHWRKGLPGLGTGKQLERGRAGGFPTGVKGYLHRYLHGLGTGKQLACGRAGSFHTGGKGYLVWAQESS